MAINGIELEVGQKWLTRGGQTVEVHAIESDPDAEWPVLVKLNRVNHYTVTPDGYVLGSDTPRDADLVQPLRRDSDHAAPMPVAEPQDSNTVTSAQVNDWIDWHGGECPVGPSTPIELRFRDGSEHSHTQPGDLRWGHNDWYGDIVAYRVVKPATEQVGKLNLRGDAPAHGVSESNAVFPGISDDARAAGEARLLDIVTKTEAQGARFFGVKPVDGIGDINSTAKGSGARYNNGKAPLELIPLSIIVPFFHDENVLSDAQAQALHALDALGMFQAREGSAYDVLRELGDHWGDCAKVFDYGRKKYSKRGDCTCSASNAVRLSLKNSSNADLANSNPENHGQYAECASAATTKTSSCETLNTEHGKQATIESGLKNLPTGNERDRVNEREPQKESLIQNISSRPSITESSSSTVSRESSTTQCLQMAAQSAGAMQGFMSTTVTQTDKSEQCFAIPATLALDLSKGLTTGLNAHSPTCGVHQVNLKSGEWNWAKGMAWSIPIGCAARHLMAIIRGEETDPESGLPHVGHVYCNVVMLLTYASTFTEGDDRPAKGMLL